MTDNNKADGHGLPFALYDAFTTVPYSGSQAAVVMDARELVPAVRAQIAKEIGVPATAFVNSVRDGVVDVQFFSTVMELPMCGHGTVCLITQLVNCGALPAAGQGHAVARLDLPKGAAHVEYRIIGDGRIEVMLDVTVPQFRAADLDVEALASALGVTPADFSHALPMEIAAADFAHLCLPVRSLAAMQSLAPDFGRLADFCRQNGLDTVAAFSEQVIDETCNVHVRDFSPAIGVPESAAAGTTNAALSAYLLRNGTVAAQPHAVAVIEAEQGIELGRPSLVTTRIHGLQGNEIRLQVGGVASRVIDGTLNVARPLQ